MSRTADATGTDVQRSWYGETSERVQKRDTADT